MKLLFVFPFFIFSCSPIHKDVSPDTKVVTIEGITYLAELGDDGDYALIEEIKAD